MWYYYLLIVHKSLTHTPNLINIKCFSQKRYLPHTHENFPSHAVIFMKNHWISLKVCYPNLYYNNKIFSLFISGFRLHL